MIAYHISVFAENRPGRLEHITALLAQAGINIRAIKISDLGEFGVVKILVDDPDAAFRVLQQAGVLASLRQILVVAVADRPGGLHAVLKILTERRINVEDSYGFVLQAQAVLVIEVADVPEAMNLLQGAGLKLLSKEEIYAL
jgi:hypothetical protein